MKPRVAINGFGRIGRMVFRKAILDNNVTVIAINASYPVETLAHLIKYDSIHGRFSASVEIVNGSLTVDNQKILLYQTRDPKGPLE